MRYSLAIIALLGLTNAIQIQAEPATEMSELGGPAAPAKAAEAATPEKAAAAPAKAAEAATPEKAATAPVPPVDGAAEKAGEPEKPKNETKVAAKIKEILKTEDEKSQEAANNAGQKIDISNAPEAINAPKALDKDGKEIKPVPLSEGENVRNAVIRNAAVGQEAIANNDNGVKDVKEKYDAKAKAQEEETTQKNAADALDKDHAEIQAKLEKQARNDTADERWTASHASTVMPVKTPILQSTVVYAQESNQAEMDKMIDEKFNPSAYGTPNSKSPFAHTDNEEVKRIQNNALDSILPYSAYMQKKTESE